MCVVSMVMDHYRDRWPPQQWPVPEISPDIYDPLEDYRKKLEDFLRKAQVVKEAKRAAEKVDRLTSQPDCEDPEKMKYLLALEERVSQLEERLAQLLGEAVE